MLVLFEFDANASVEHDAIHRTPHLGGIELRGPGGVGVLDGVWDGVVGEVLTAEVEREVLKFAGYLGLQLVVVVVARVVVEELAWAIELGGEVELPEF